MRKRTPSPAAERAPLPDFTPVPRKCARHDGWTPERQRAFIQALAETGSVTTAARMVNMAHATAYALRHHPEAAEFRRAWDAALSCGVQRLRDEAFDRAVNGQLVPLMHKGKVVGYRRVKNDRLLMYLLRHYGQGAKGERVTINYFAPSNRGATRTPLPLSREGDSRGTRQGKGPALPPVSTKPLLSPPDPAETVAAFAGVPLDEEAQSQIVAALEACAARRRDLPPEEDTEASFVAAADAHPVFCGQFELIPDRDLHPEVQPGEEPWDMLDKPESTPEMDAAVEAVLRAKAAGYLDRPEGDDVAG